MARQPAPPPELTASERRRRRSDIWTWVYGPLLGGIALLAAGAVCAGGAGGSGAGAWADVSIIYLTSLSMVGLLLLGVVVGVVLYGVARLSGWLPGMMGRARAWVSGAQRAVRRGADLSVEPVLFLGAVRGAARQALTRLGVFRRGRRGRSA